LFRKSVQLVQVDVVVTDKNGNPIQDLKESDFTVLQDGVAREVRVYEPHSLTTLAASQPPETRLPENTYTNLPNSGNDEARVILVFDMLNTPVQDQQYAQKQLVKVLREIPDGRRIAVFALSEKLTLVQGFTTDKQQLLAAADSLSAERSHQYVGSLQTQQSAGALAGLKMNTEPAISMPAQAGSQSVDPSVIGAPKSLPIREESSFLTSARVEFTLDAFETLARAVSGYPGRKSVLWLSGGFPVAIAPDPELETATRGAENYREQLARTSRLLATSRIAMYPIDVRGIQPRGVDISLSTAETEGLLEMRQPANNHVGTGGTLDTNNGLGNLLNQQSRTYSYERSTLLNVAYDTGGRAFIGSNNIRQAIARGMEDSAMYYTLAYSPDPNETKLAYHKIEVKIARPDVKLTYRRGYYAIPQPAAGSADSAVAVLRGSLQPGMPPATSLYLTARVSPPRKPGEQLKIDYVINPNGVTFADAEKGSKHAMVDCMAVAFDLQGREIAHASDTLDATIPAEQYEWVMRRGLPANQEIALKPGTYNLRLGVMDRSTQQIGTLDVPVTIPAN
jgi:VWFA-related protein